MSELSTKKDWVDAIRERLGIPSDVELPSELVSASLDDAIRTLNRWCPSYQYFDLDLVKGVAEYDLDENVISLIDVWIAPTAHSSLLEDDVMNLLGGTHDVHGALNKFDSPSLMLIIEQKWEQWRSRHEYEWEYMVDRNKLRIRPASKYSGKAAYRARVKRDIESIPEKWKDGFMDLVMAKALDMLALKRGTFDAVPMGVGDVSYNVSLLREMAKERLDDAKSKLTRAGTTVIIG